MDLKSMEKSDFVYHFWALMEYMVLIIMDFLDKKEVLAECIERKLSTLTM